MKNFAVKLAVVFINTSVVWCGSNSLLAPGDTLIRDGEVRNRVYGDPPFTLSNNIVGKTVVYSSSDTTVAAVWGNTVIIKKAGTTVIKAEIPGDTQTTKNFIVYKKQLTVTTPNVWRVQGTANPKFVVNITGFVNGEDESVLISKPVAFCNANAASPPGEYPITITGGSAQNYSFWYDNTSKLKVVGVALPDDSWRVSLSPNPASDKLTLNGVEGPFTIEIIDLTGTVRMQEYQTQPVIDISHLPEGIYLVKIKDAVSTTVKKLIIRR